MPVDAGGLPTGRAALRVRRTQIVPELDLGVRCTPAQDLLLCHVPAAKRARVDGLLPSTACRRPAASRRSGAGPRVPGAADLRPRDDRRGDHPAGLHERDRGRGLGDLDVVLRMAGCPNWCSRPPTAEIGINGYGKNDHVVPVGGARDGSRIGRVLYERVPEEGMTLVLIGLLRALRDHNPGRLPPGEYLWQTPLEEAASARAARDLRQGPRDLGGAMAQVELEVAGGIATVTFNRPRPTLNSLSSSLLAELDAGSPASSASARSVRRS